MAAIGRTELSIVAGHRGSSLAGSLVAEVAQRAGVPVVAALLVGQVVASLIRRTAVIGAGVGVVAAYRRARHTLPFEADVCACTEVVVAACAIEGRVGAPTAGQATIEGTGIAVIAGEVAGARAASSLATVAGGATVEIVARKLIGEELAPCEGVAAVVRAHIGVIACQGLSGDAHPVHTGVTLRTDVPIATWRGMRGVGTAVLDGAEIHGAGVGVVAVQRSSAHA